MQSGDSAREDAGETMAHLLIRLTLVPMLLLVGITLARAESVEAQGIVDKAKATVNNLAADPNLPAFRTYAARAKGMLIVPTMVKGGFIIGASGGSGVLIGRDEKLGWSYPAFYTLGSVTFGLQIGGEVSEIALLVMTQSGMDSLLASSAKLGGDVSIAAGPVGAGAKAQTTDILAFSRTKGLYGGINLEGAIIDVRDDWNRDYYGKEVRPTDIMVKRSVSNAAADDLRAAVAKAGKGQK